MLMELLAVMAPVLCGAAIGFFWVRLGNEYPMAFVTRLVLYIGTPALILNALGSAEIDNSSFLRTGLATLTVMALLLALSWPFSRLISKPWKVAVAPLLFSNVGNMGLPVSLYAFGQAGFAYAITIMVTMSLLQFTLGAWLASTSGNPLRSVVRSPTIWASILATTLLLSDIHMPRFVANSLELISGFTVPLMLITLGVSLASIRVRNLAAGVGFSALRIPFAAACAWGIGTLLELPPLALHVLVMQMAMPVAVYNYMFAQKAGREPEYVATLVFCSTLAAFLYLPALLAVLGAEMGQ